jgi:hypothetical protein
LPLVQKCLRHNPAALLQTEEDLLLSLIMSLTCFLLFYRQTSVALHGNQPPQILDKYLYIHIPAIIFSLQLKLLYLLNTQSSDIPSHVAKLSALEGIVDFIRFATGSLLTMHSR